MNIEDWVRRNGRIAHTSDIIKAGATRYGIRAALASGSLVRVRRDWLALPDCDPQLKLAAQCGGRLTCVTAAQRMGLWVLPDNLLHLAVAPNAGRLPGGSAVKPHWSAGPTPTSRLMLIDPLENVLVRVAECQPFESAVVVLDSALRLHRTTAAQLRRIPTKSTRFATALDAASEFSDSGIESIPCVRFARIGIVVRQQVIIDDHPVDGLIGDRLVLQIDGYGPHSNADRRRRDLRQDGRLTLMGYTVFRFDYVQVLGHWAYVESTVLSAMAQGLHLTAGPASFTRPASV
jgi:very-short-patch-repair endonuclease